MDRNIVNFTLLTDTYEELYRAFDTVISGLDRVYIVLIANGEDSSMKVPYYNLLSFGP